ncbi:hypothetical protein F2P56_002362 [Juglans regia]|uniref:Protein FAR1-RELATED SEQUENCE n=1 Tax=Juglans regia TaxID=51240 RepID=A0A834DAZ3_JUGRE|nr:hypothetical protein F2P56_002362 [Juglans regia]
MNQDSPNWSLGGCLISDAKEILNLAAVWSISHAYREANMATHMLAQAAYECTEDMYDIEICPASVRSLPALFFGFVSPSLASGGIVLIGIVSMEKGEDHSVGLTPSSSNSLSTNTSYKFQYGMGPPIPLITTSSATSSRVHTEDPPNCKETEKPDTSSRLNEESKEDTPDSRDTEDGSAGTLECVQMDGGDTIEEPKSVMEFNSFEELLTYYKQYGKKCGFGVMIKRSEKVEDGTIRYVTLACARGGKARNRTLNVAKLRPTGKTECKSKINVLKVEGKVRLTICHNIHNHGLNPQKSRFFRCNREVSETVKRVLDTNDLAEIRMNKSFGSLVVGAGGFENLPFLENDCRNYMDKARHMRLGKGGAGALQDYFLRMQYKNPWFFALIDLDDEGRLKNVFWANPRSRATYQYFGDVVTFDTTYLTNRYGMPYAPFVGVNHHDQSILLGVGLISSEDTEIFVWLFQAWLKCMDGITPRAIITDHDKAMKNAIAIVFPESRH